MNTLLRPRTLLQPGPAPHYHFPWNVSWSLGSVREEGRKVADGGKSEPAKGEAFEAERGREEKSERERRRLGVAHGREIFGRQRLDPPLRCAFLYISGVFAVLVSTARAWRQALTSRRKR